jgi:hypothetical protein
MLPRLALNSQALVILLLQPPECWDYRHALLRPVKSFVKVVFMCSVLPHTGSPHLEG